jgi:hypothetical protein
LAKYLHNFLIAPPDQISDKTKKENQIPLVAEPVRITCSYGIAQDIVKF